MSEEIASADSLLTINADLSRQIGELHTTIGYQDAMLAHYRRCLEAVVHFWRNDPLAFGDDASVTTLAGRFADIAQLCEGALESMDAGAQLRREIADLTETKASEK